MVVCKYGCGAEFPDDQKGQAEYMRHCNYECPNNPKSKFNVDKQADLMKPEIIQTTVQPKVAKTAADIPGEGDDNLDESGVLDTIIAEASKTAKRPSIVRMVRRHLGDKEDSIKTLAEALRLADIPHTQRSLILKNWATYKEIPDIEELLESDKKEEKKKTTEEKDKEEKVVKDAIEDEMERSIKDEMRALNLLRLRRERKLLEREMEEPKKEEKNDKIPYIHQGVQLMVTPEQMMSWERWKVEQKKLDEEREERRLGLTEKVKRSDNELVEWVVGEGSNTRTIKIRPETLPLLIQSQSKKDNGGEELKTLREELKDQRNMFQSFQTAVLQKELDEVKAQLSVNPIDRLMQDKQKLEALGIVRSDRVSAQEQMYAMDRKKLDTLLNIVVDKSHSTGEKVDKIFTLFGPLAQDAVQSAYLQTKQQRGGGQGQEVTRDEKQTEETLQELEKIEKGIENKSYKPQPGEPKVVSIEKTQKPQETVEGENK
jgi:hypothetical protein